MKFIVSYCATILVELEMYPQSCYCTIKINFYNEYKFKDFAKFRDLIMQLEILNFLLQKRIKNFEIKHFMYLVVINNNTYLKIKLNFVIIN